MPTVLPFRATWPRGHQRSEGSSPNTYPSGPATATPGHAASGGLRYAAWSRDDDRRREEHGELLTIPDLWWQVQHGWATITMTRQLNTENGGVGNFGNWIGGQLIMAADGLIWVWLCGLRFLWRSDRPL